MFAYIKDGVKKFPYNLSLFAKDFPNISVPATATVEQLAEVGLFSVTQTPPPPVAFSEVAKVSDIEFVNGQWQTVWTVDTLSAEDLAAKQQDLISSIVDATQARLDTFAQTRNYDGILSACTYATSSVPKFQAEGQYCVGVRDATWASLYQYLADVEGGVKPVPTSFADVESSLPVLTWPL